MAAVALTLSLPAWAAGLPYSDDSDLSPSRGIRLPVLVPLELSADEVTSSPLDDSSALEIEVFRENKGQPTPVPGLTFELRGPDGIAPARTDSAGTDGVARFRGCRPGTALEAIASLENQHVGITDGSSTYRIRAHVSCGARTRIRFAEASDGGQAMGIWQLAERARIKLDASVGLAFWNSRLTFVWPGDADYYSWGQVHITRGDHWDVVGHEMGHGIYDLAEVGSFGGGEHKIDECYSTALALSEGWASYFSGWVSVALDDVDARFEHMVPRRAPIRFENVPEDVCAGQENEWRVTAFFWDLIDLANDGEGSVEPFARVWRALAASHSRSAQDAARALERSGVPSELIDIAWLLNFKSPR